MEEQTSVASRGEFLDILVQESDRLNRVVEDFLTMARPEPSAQHPCDLNEELRNMITLLAAQARQSRITLELNPSTLPPFSGDGAKLRQAFMNIILNAIQASPPGGVVAVSTAADRENGRIEIRFSDHGPGIPAEAAGKIFEPFFTTKGAGTGLGLPITKKIIEGHGGTIALESEPGHGATFRVRLPSR